MAEKISFIIPCYRSEHTILDVVQELRTMMENLNTYDFEIVLVNDASPDHVWNVIQKLCSDQRMKGIGLSRNFGQASAVMAGFANVSGDYIFVLDDDGQSPLDAVMEMTDTLKKRIMMLCMALHPMCSLDGAAEPGQKSMGLWQK